MCGIAGVVEQRVSAAVLERMRDVLAHRGPDDAGLFLSEDQRVGLAHRRLAIIDITEGGHQPMRSPGGSYLTYNGEIYNYLELREELRALGVEFRSESDSEVLLLAYETWGEACVERLNGMFAFAIYDEKRKIVFAARDRFGEKPFHYHLAADGTFVFASEAKALLTHPKVPRRANMQAIYRFLQLGEADAEPDTFFEGIFTLPAAHSLTFDLGSRKLRTQRYWALEDRGVTTESDAALIEQFRALLADSIRLRLRSDVEVGSCLSGGLDSSSVVGLIAKMGVSQGQHTFSARFPGSVLDEGKYIQDVVTATGVHPHFVAPDPARIPGELERLTWHQDYPFLSLSLYAQWCVMRSAHEAGVTVLLDGQGGDEVLTGYHGYFGVYFRDLGRRFRLGTLAREMTAYGRQHGAKNLKIVGYYLAPAGIRDRIRGVVREDGLNAEFVAQYLVPRQTAPRVFRDELTDSLHASLTTTSLPSLLRYADRNSMAFAREVRLPYLDHRLVELAYTMPNHLRLRNATTKVLLRESMRGVIPESVRTRRDKVGFAPPQGPWLQGPMKEWAGDLLNSQVFGDRPWIDAAQARATWQRFVDGNARFGSSVWRWLSLEVWARTFLDAPDWLTQPIAPTGKDAIASQLAQRELHV